MNIYQTVLDTVTLSTDITESAGFINIKGTNPIAIPKAGVMGAKRVLAGERRQVWTVAIPSTPSNSTTYTVSVSGKSPVTGILKSYIANYTTAASGTTQAILSAGLAASLVSYESPFDVTGSGTATLTITAKSGTPVISVASNLLTVTYATTALSAAATATNNTTNTTIAATGAFGSANASRGSLVTISDAASAAGLSYLGIITANADADNAVAQPVISATTAGGNDSLYTVDNSGATLENIYAYASLPGVTLTAGTKYVIYEIDSVAPSYAGNGARPDVIDSKYIIYVNATLANVWTSTTGFDAFLATLCGLTTF